MTVIKSIIIIALQLALYYICGCAAESAFRIKGRGVKTILMGFFTYYILFEFVYLPVMLISGKLIIMMILWIISMIAIIVLYIVRFRSVGLATSKAVFKNVRYNGGILGIGVIIVAAAVYVIGMMSVHEDVSGYGIGAIADALRTGKMFATESYSGVSVEYRDMPAALSGFYMNFAVYAAMFGMTAVEVTHIVMNVLGVIMSAVVVYCIGKRVSEADPKAGAGFLIAYMILSLFLVSDNSAGGYLVGRAYDERAFGANVVVPALIYALISFWRGKDKDNAIKRMLIVIIGSVVVSVSSLYPVLIILLVNFIAFFIVNRNTRYVRSAVVCILPVLGYVIIYTILCVVGEYGYQKSGFFNALSGYLGDNRVILPMTLLSLAAVISDAGVKNRVRIIVISVVSLLIVYNGVASGVITSLVGVNVYYMLIAAIPVTYMGAYGFYKAFTGNEGFRMMECIGGVIVLVCMVASGTVGFPRLHKAETENILFTFEQNEAERETVICDRSLFGHFRSEGTAVAYNSADSDEHSTDAAISRFVNEGSQEKIEDIRDALTERDVKYVIVKSEFNMDVYMSALLYTLYEQTGIYTVYEHRSDADVTEAPVFYYDGWNTMDGVDYWYENGVRQGYRPDDPYYQGKELYDEKTDSWYFLDNSLEGAKAIDKDIFFTYGGGTFPDRVDGDGRWVRYGADGRMVYGWDVNDNGTYYFNPQNGEMAKGSVEIDGETYYFDPYSGILQTGEN